MEHIAQIDAPWRDPVEVLSAFAEEPWALALISGGASGTDGRWSYVARWPDAVLKLDAAGSSDPFTMIRQLRGPQRLTARDAPPFQGGVVALAAYELADCTENLGLPRRLDWPDLIAARYSAFLAFDREAFRLVAFGRGATPMAADQAARGALTWLQLPVRGASSGDLAAQLQPSSGSEYERAVQRVRERILAGDIFQANIARVWTGRLAAGASPFDLFARLAGESPAPFAAYLRAPGLALVSNSPERFLQVRGDQAVARPIKGTRPRGRHLAEDVAYVRQLVASEKDRAENLMIVDLMRNDLARVCEPGTVKVPSLFAVESFANVHHLVSTVTGRLAPGRDSLDLLKAAFPPGSITGAPKRQAMKTIAELEAPRGPYCGSLIWAGYDGAMESSVLIRTAACAEDADGWRIEARAGAGIVADSDPQAERLETEVKVRALARALAAGADT